MTDALAKRSSATIPLALAEKLDDKFSSPLDGNSCVVATSSISSSRVRQPTPVSLHLWCAVAGPDQEVSRTTPLRGRDLLHLIKSRWRRSRWVPDLRYHW